MGSKSDEVMRKPKPGETWFRFIERARTHPGHVSLLSMLCLHVTRNGWYSWGYLHCPDDGFCTRLDGWCWGRTPREALDRWIDMLTADAYSAGLRNEGYKECVLLAVLITRSVGLLFKYEQTCREKV